MMYIIAGLYRKQRLAAPKGAETRPTASRLREALFNICQQTIDNAHFLDIFAGSGAMGFEALSRGAQSATFIDSSKEAIRCIRQNAEQLKVEKQCQILHGEAFTMLKKLERQGQIYDIIYADPPYGLLSSDAALYSEAIIHWIDAHSILAPGGILFVEEEVRHQPILDNLKTLQLKDSRRMGPAMLHQYLRGAND